MKWRLIGVFGGALIYVSGLLLGYAQAGAACPGFSSRLFGLSEAQVTPGSANNVRDMPTTSGERIGQIEGGAVFQIIDGPTCADNYTWWNVSYGTLTGWTAEGSIEAGYFLQVVDANSVTQDEAEGNPLPQDLAQGIAFSSTGLEITAPELCFEQWSQGSGLPHAESIIIPPGARTGTIAVHLADEFQIRSINNGGSYSVELSPAGSNIYPTPAICIPGGVDENEAHAVAPDGTLFAAPVQSRQLGRIPMGQVKLPFEAFVTPGVWTLQVPDYQVFVVIQPVTEPTQIYERFRDFRNFILAGYPPNETVYLLTSAGESVFVPINAQGYGQHTLASEARYFRAIVPEDGRNIQLATSIYVGSPSNPRFIITDETASRYIFDSVWRGVAIPLSEWTCPGSLPIRLSQDTQAIALTSGTLIRPEAGFVNGSHGRIAANMVFEVLQGVWCVDGTTWWQIYSPDFDATGYLPESFGGEYVLAPTR